MARTAAFAPPSPVRRRFDAPLSAAHSWDRARYEAKLAGHAHAFLRLRLFLRRRLCRELQHGCFMTLAQECQEQRLSVGQFERVVVLRLIAVDLTENCRLMLGRPASTIHRYFRIEGEFRAGQHADRGPGIARSGEPAGAGSEIRRSKLVADARRARFDVHQTIIAHGMRLLCSTSARLTRGAPHSSLVM